MNKLICPECGANLRYYREYVLTAYQEINPNTQIPQNRLKTRGEGYGCSDMEGFECSNRMCAWSLNTINESSKITPELNQWLKKYRDTLKVDSLFNNTGECTIKEKHEDWTKNYK